MFRWVAAALGCSSIAVSREEVRFFGSVDLVVNGISAGFGFKGAACIKGAGDFAIEAAGDSPVDGCAVPLSGGEGGGFEAEGGGCGEIAAHVGGSGLGSGEGGGSGFGLGRGVGVALSFEDGKGMGGGFPNFGLGDVMSVEQAGSFAAIGAFGKAFEVGFQGGAVAGWEGCPGEAFGFGGAVAESERAAGV